ncbi:hypothetical protein EV363DRAFT_65666 [Boletus edulis]|nr:hypothetical protein EV363DRAFT_65666 [Boletus edulis]
MPTTGSDQGDLASSPSFPRRAASVTRESTSVFDHIASTSIHGPHRQHIDNIHLQRFDSEAQIWNVLYLRYLTPCIVHAISWTKLVALAILTSLYSSGTSVVSITSEQCVNSLTTSLAPSSLGCDAGEHEYPSMSRRHRKVPVGSYHQFTRETCNLADLYAHGRVVSVLEDG